jgi:hypothetical protein
MSKQHVNISLENELVEKAKKKFINLSEVAEKGIMKALGEIEVTISEPESCEFCGREGRKETIDDIEKETNTRDEVKHPELLTWLWPDCKWMCNACLRLKCKEVPIVGGVHQ